MPTIDGSVLLTVVIAIFSAGITWGIMSAKSKTTDTRVHETVTELKDAVKEIRSIATDLQVLKAATGDNKADIKSLEERVTSLEINVAKLQH